MVGHITHDMNATRAVELDPWEFGNDFQISIFTLNFCGHFIDHLHPCLIIKFPLADAS